ncbi:ABC transporter permease [Micrococcus lylae]|uniref:ABC transporter permease n=1 Tax=Micrococcus lylae TaxID=1273 RepID=UPI003EBEA912
MIGTLWADLRAQRLRSVLTGLSMLVGVLVVVGISAASAVVDDVFVASAEQQDGIAGSHVLTLPPATATQALDAAELTHRRLGGAPARLEVSTTNPLMLSAHDAPDPDLRSVETLWTSGSLTDFHRYPVLAGSPGLGPGLPAVVILNAAAAEVGLQPGDSVWTPLADGGTPTRLTVSGIVDDGHASPRMWAPLALWELQQPPDPASTQTLLRFVVPPEKATDAAAAVTAAAAAAGVDPGAEQPVRVDRVGELRDSLSFMQAVFSAVAAAALLVSALGLLNIGLASIAERSRELVVRRALGAQRRHLFVQVMGSSLLLAVIVTVVAVGLVIGLMHLAAPLWLPEGGAHRLPAVPWEAFGLGLSAAALTAALGSALPAWKATRLPVADALRR